MNEQEQNNQAFADATDAALAAKFNPPAQQRVGKGPDLIMRSALIVALLQPHTPADRKIILSRAKDILAGRAKLTREEQAQLSHSQDI